MSVMVALFLAMASSGISSGQPDLIPGSIGDFWTYDCEIWLSSLVLDGSITITYRGEADRDISERVYHTDMFEWRGKLSITGFYGGAIPDGTATFVAYQYKSSPSGWDVVTDTNMTLDFTTCVGSYDEADHYGWSHIVRSFIPLEGFEDRPMPCEVGESLSEQFSAIETVHGSFYAGELISYSTNYTDNATCAVTASESVESQAGLFECLILETSRSHASTSAWIPSNGSMPARMEMDHPDLRVWHAGEYWNMTLVDYGSDSGGVLALASLGIAGTLAVGAAALALRRSRLRSPPVA